MSESVALKLDVTFFYEYSSEEYFEKCLEGIRKKGIELYNNPFDEANMWITIYSTCDYDEMKSTRAIIECVFEDGEYREDIPEELLNAIDEKLEVYCRDIEINEYSFY